ncbi:MAG TPA: hypothetical protein EYO33_05720 [Phycisphaerales bacterium]|nr:hypothetical protein [Phycisphaerales bacterium]
MKKTLFYLLLLSTLAWGQPGDSFNQGKVDELQSVEAYQGCSLGCALNWKTTVSSALPDSGGNRYGAAQLEDTDFQTCWAEAARGDGIGEYMEFVISKDKGPKNVPFSGFSIKNGYTKSQDIWSKNNRVKEMTLSINGKSQSTISLLDTSKSQWVALKGVRVNPGDVVRLTIKSVYPGSKYQDTCVSEILLSGAH